MPSHPINKGPCRSRGAQFQFDRSKAGCYNQDKKAAASAKAVAPKLNRFEEVPPCLWGGYFFVVMLITPKMMTANRLSSAIASKTVIGLTPFQGNNLPLSCLIKA